MTSEKIYSSIKSIKRFFLKKDLKCALFWIVYFYVKLIQAGVIWGKKGPQLRIYFLKLGKSIYKTFSWLVMHVWCSNHFEWVTYGPVVSGNKQLLPPHPCTVWVPALSFFSDGTQSTTERISLSFLSDFGQDAKVRPGNYKKE